MVYKIEGNLEEGLGEKLEEISSKYLVLIVSGAVFVAQKSFADAMNLREIFNEDEFFIQEITPENLKYEPPAIQEWCRDNFVQLDTQRFECKEQARLHDLWERLDKFENELKKGGSHG